MAAERLAIVLNASLPNGTAANATAVLSLSLGANHPHLIGSDLRDADGGRHPGITSVPIPILAANRTRLAELARAADDEVTVVGFTDTAARSHTYDAYESELAATHADRLDYLGIALAGPHKRIASLTGALPLYR